MKAFITGSRAYGTVSPSSDIDLVVLVDESALAILRKWSECEEKTSEGYKKIRFGDLNIIATTDETEFAVWKVGTEHLKREKPVTRKQAKSVLDSYREEVGIKDKSESQEK